MATAEELLATVGNEQNYIVIDSDLRTMTFPASVKNIGVENDKDVHKLNFMMPRYFGEYDLSTFNIRINYLNAQGDGDMYVVTEPTVEDDAIYFSWLVGRHACLYKGAVTFIVCLKLADGEGDVAQEFNTTLASMQVLPGLETEPTILETDYDIIEQLLLEIGDTNDKIQAILDSGMNAEELGRIAAEQAQLKSRMDEFTSLTDGSTTGDAELADGRVGYDGATYTNIGGAIRGQVRDLNMRIGSVPETYEEVTTTDTWTVGGFSALTVGETLTFNSSTVWYHAYFPVTAGQTYNATLYATASTTNTYGVFTNESMTVISVAYRGATTAGTQTFNDITAPEGATRLYIITYKNHQSESHVSALVVGDLQGQINELEGDVEVVDSKTRILLSDEIAYQTETTRYKLILVSNGRINDTQSDYSVTGLIPVSAGNVIFVPATTASAAVSLVAKQLPNSSLLYESLVDSSDTNNEDYYFVIEDDCNVSFCINTDKINLFKIFNSIIDVPMNAIQKLSERIDDIPRPRPIPIPIPSKGQILYVGDTISNSGYICNAVMYDDGIIIAARSNGQIVRIKYDGTEETLLSLTGENMDWRGLFKDSNDNVFASPHASWGTMAQADRGLYKLVKGENSMRKVLSLYDPSSTVTTETETNNDTIWTMCEDDDGNLYAGVYAHTIRSNPAIYKSTDSGETWSYIFNFNDEGLTTDGDGRHIHTIIYSKWKKALYCIVGEINTIFKSIDGGNTWTDLNIVLTVKGSSMCATPYGIFIGSDGARHCDIDILYNDDETHEKVFRGWANTVFAIRQSDLTGFLYAFTKIDSSVNTEALYPPATVISGTTTIEEWQSQVTEVQYNNWLRYHDSIVSEYPDDSIRPQHYAILISRDGGKNWEVLKRFSCSSTEANGMWTTGYFKNGECLTGRMEDRTVLRPVIISEGKHKYVSNGCDLDGDILIRTNSNSVVTLV